MYVNTSSILTNIKYILRTFLLFLCFFLGRRLLQLSIINRLGKFYIHFMLAFDDNLTNNIS